jgi:hypothetical protein
MGLAHSPRIVTSGLVLCLDAGNTKSYPGSGTAWTDLSGSGYNGTLTNGPTFSNTNGGGIVLDGTNDYVDTTLTGVINDVTVECWFNGTKTARNHLWNFGNTATDTPPGNNLMCDLNDGYDLWVFWNSGGTNRVRYNITGNFTDSTNRSLVFTHTGTTNKVYSNGVELVITESGGTQSFSNVNAAGSFNLGGSSWTFGGTIFLARVYNRALSAAEVSQNYNALRGRYGI